MATNTENMEELVSKDYEHGFVTDIDTDTVEPGLNEDVITFISKKKEEPAARSVAAFTSNAQL